MKEERKGNWWGRNWKWLVPVGCMGIFLLFAAFAAALTMGVLGFMKSSDVYKRAIAKAKSDERVQRSIGVPIKEGWFFSGNIKVNGQSGRADLVVPISGPNGKAIIYAKAEKSAGVWTFSTFFVVVNKTKAKIDLLHKRKQLDFP